MEIIFNKKIGIWGLGVSGKSIANFLDSKGIEYSTQLDSKFPESFLESNDIIIPSPGIDLRPWKKYANKFLAEIDFFVHFFTKPTVGVTGTLGKTTITFLLNELLKKNNLNSIAAGNIGIGMCDIINQQDNLDIAVLELSSFQLEFCKSYTPRLAVLTNFFPNHLDRHIDLEEYKNAKLNLFKNLTVSDYALVPIELAHEFNFINTNIFYFAKNFALLSSSNIHGYPAILGDATSSCHGHPERAFRRVEGYFLDNNKVCFWNGLDIKIVTELNKEHKQKTFFENWLIICAALNILNCKNFNVSEDVLLPAHRMEKVIKNEIIFYNDSKSTVIESTLKAVASCNNPILFLGGLSKGVDRSNMFEEIKNKVSFVICFGQEAGLLNNLCIKNNIKSCSFKNLEDAVEFCIKFAKKGDEVLFSPGGSSFDLFENYCHRGDRFKELVNLYFA